MTTDSDFDVEALLRRYRPVGPPRGLRARVVQARRDRRAWPWAAAAAALLVGIVLIEEAASRIVQGLTRPEPGVAAAVADLAVAMGGDDEARSLASVVVANQRTDVQSLPIEEMSMPTAGADR